MRYPAQRQVWDKAAFLYSTVGCNGKGTLCELMRNLCGPRTYASTSLVEFGKEFMLEPLMRASAIIVDENDVGEFFEKNAKFKAVITNDVIQINRKYAKPLAFSSTVLHRNQCTVPPAHGGPVGNRRQSPLLRPGLIF